MRYPHWLFAIGACSAMTPCGAQVRDSAGIRIVTSTAPRWTDATALRVDAAPIFSVGTNPAVPQEQFSTVQGAAHLSDGSVIVSDRKALELRLFDSHGAFVRTIGQKGEGPGDFRGAVAVFVTAGDTIVTWDVRANRLTWFNAAGHTLRTLLVAKPVAQTTPDGGHITATFALLGGFGDGTFLAMRARRIRFSEPTSMHVDSMILSNVAGSTSTDLGGFMQGESWVFERNGTVSSNDRPFGRRGTVAMGQAAFYYADGRQFEISEYSPTGKLVRRFGLQRMPAPVTAQDIKASKAAAIAAASEKYRAMQEEIQAWMSFPRNMPAFDTLAVDPGGRVWARLYDPKKAASRWEVFGTDGGYLGTVVLPAVMDILQIGKDFILGRTRTTDDEETVRVYRLH